MISTVRIADMPLLKCIDNAAFVFFRIKANKDEVPGNESWSRAAIQFIVKGSKILRIGPDVPLFKGNSVRS